MEFSFGQVNVMLLHTEAEILWFGFVVGLSCTRLTGHDEQGADLNLAFSGRKKKM